MRLPYPQHTTTRMWRGYCMPCTRSTTTTSVSLLATTYIGEPYIRIACSTTSMDINPERTLMHYHITIVFAWRGTLTYILHSSRTVPYLELLVFQKWVDMRVLVDRHVRDSCGGKLLIHGKDLSNISWCLVWYTKNDVLWYCTLCKLTQIRFWNVVWQYC